MEGQGSDRRSRVTAVGMVELDEGVEALLGVCLVLAASQNLVWRGTFVRLDGFRPPQQVCFVGVRGLRGIGPSKYMTAWRGHGRRRGVGGGAGRPGALGRTAAEREVGM